LLPTPPEYFFYCAGFYHLVFLLLTDALGFTGEKYRGIFPGVSQGITNGAKLSERKESSSLTAKAFGNRLLDHPTIAFENGQPHSRSSNWLRSTRTAFQTVIHKRG